MSTLISATVFWPGQSNKFVLLSPLYDELQGKKALYVQLALWACWELEVRHPPLQGRTGGAASHHLILHMVCDPFQLLGGCGLWSAVL